MSNQISEWLEVVARILLRCWIFGFLLLIVWAGVFLLAGNLIYSLHGSMRLVLRKAKDGDATR